MPHEWPGARGRAELREWMDEPCSREVMRACLQDLAMVNGWLLAYRPVLDYLESLALAFQKGPLRILDVGSGYGDTLRRIEQWGRNRGIDMELTGIDLNPDSGAIAAGASGDHSAIRWVTADVFAYELDRPAHVVMSSLFTHHLPDPDVVRFLEWMERNSEVGWIVNDLSRAPIPYYLFTALAKVLRLHAFVQHDGPVSIARAFVQQDWHRLCAEAGLDSGDVVIRGYKPGRLCVTRRKSE